MDARQKAMLEEIAARRFEPACAPAEDVSHRRGNRELLPPSCVVGLQDAEKGEGVWVRGRMGQDRGAGHVDGRRCAEAVKAPLLVAPDASGGLDYFGICHRRSELRICEGAGDVEQILELVNVPDLMHQMREQSRVSASFGDRATPSGCGCRGDVPGHGQIAQHVQAAAQKLVALTTL